MEETQTVPKVLDIKKATISAIFKNALMSHKAEHKTFLSKQYIQKEELFQKCQETQGIMEHLTETNKEDTGASVSCDKLSLDSNLTMDSTATGHMMHCLNDSSRDSSTVFNGEKCETSNTTAKIPKRPFLRKGHGLKRYMPPSVRKTEPAEKTNSSGFQKKTVHPQFEDNWKVKQNHASTASLASQANHVNFKEPKFKIANEKAFLEVEGSNVWSGIDKEFPNENTEGNYIPTTRNWEYSLNQKEAPHPQFEDNWRIKQNQASSSSLASSRVNRVRFKEPEFHVANEESCFEGEESNVLSEIESEVSSGNQNFIPGSPNCDDSFTQEKEKKELAQFELLETCTQDSSFNSDSSVVQHIFSGMHNLRPQYSQNVPHNVEIDNEKQNRNLNTPESPSPKISLFQFSQNCLKAQQKIKDLMLGIDPRIKNLQKELYNPEIFTENEGSSNKRCSTPIIPTLPQKQFSSAVSGCDDGSRSPISSPGICGSQKYVNEWEDDSDHTLNGEDAAAQEDFQSSAGTDEKDAVTSLTSEVLSERTSEEKSILKEKIKELEKEIEIYQSHNNRLSEICKEREEISKKLKKEYDGIEKYKEEQKKKLDTEIEDERRQLKRQKETFNRYQKLCKDNPSRKEREELCILRQEVEKLQEELKRQRIKFTSDNKRMKNQLIAAEKERDCLKLENITLEEQCQDLITVLKTRNSKNKKLDLPGLSIYDEKNLHNNTPDTASDEKNTNNSDSENVKFTIKKTPTSSRSGKVNSSLKPRVRFNLTPQFSNGQSLLGENETKNVSSDKNESTESTEDANEDSGVESTNLSELDEPLPKEIKHGDKVVKIHPSGDREIIFSDGTRKITSADEGTVKIFFLNGDVKDIYPDKRKIYRYADGVVEKSFPCGLKIIESPNGQVERHFSDGLRELKFPDGTLHYFHTDGSEEIIGADGTTVSVGADGTEIIESKNKGREIRTATYKRREFPDGSVRVLYKTGRQESRYSNGRIIIKNENGKVILDTKHSKGIKG